MQRTLAVSVRHLNRLRATWQRNRRKGRPRHVAGSPAAGGALVQVTPHLSYVGVHLFAHWLDQQEAFEPVVARLQQAIEAHKRAHPADNFALLIIAARHCVAVLRPCFWRPCLALSTSRRLTPMSSRSRRCLAGAITAPR